MIKEVKDILKIFSRNNQNVINIDKPIRKDLLGRMPYIVISEDSDLNPIYIQRIDGKLNLENNSNNDLTIFRYSMSPVFK